MEDSLWHWMKYYIRIVPNGTFYNYTIKFPTEEKYIQRDFLT
jgi:hypothetical protein